MWCTEHTLCTVRSTHCVVTQSIYSVLSFSIQYSVHHPFSPWVALQSALAVFRTSLGSIERLTLCSEGTNASDPEKLRWTVDCSDGELHCVVIQTLWRIFG